MPKGQQLPAQIVENEEEEAWDAGVGGMEAQAAVLAAVRQAQAMKWPTEKGAIKGRVP